MIKSFRSIIGAVTILGLLASPAFAAQTKEELLKSLQEKMVQLRAQIEALQQAQTAVQNTQTEIQGTLGLIRNLREGMTGDDVKKLQELLSEDKAIPRRTHNRILWAAYCKGSEKISSAARNRPTGYRGAENARETE